MYADDLVVFSPSSAGLQQGTITKSYVKIYLSP